MHVVMYEKELLDESFWPGGYATTPEKDGVKILKQHLTKCKNKV